MKAASWTSCVRTSDDFDSGILTGINILPLSAAIAFRLMIRASLISEYRKI
ncbi:hypothetical protein Pla52n_20400 [Stieleria varia]|uniref:Uncharacterized protein n=1 Tax=Stieleria varia TaxID=2528005 RepID=A0A5C6B4T6_9BACT|nr:hypothetical protein Pla52n_20400 [Stieleria varia]